MGTSHKYLPPDRLLTFTEKFERPALRIVATILNFVFLALQIFGAVIWDDIQFCCEIVDFIN